MAKKEFPGNIKKFGKGSNRRPEDLRKVEEHWDEINWHNQWCAMCGEMTNHTNDTCPQLEWKRKQPNP